LKEYFVTKTTKPPVVVSKVSCKQLHGGFLDRMTGVEGVVLLTIPSYHTERNQERPNDNKDNREEVPEHREMFTAKSCQEKQERNHKTKSGKTDDANTFLLSP
jgi:hypothetical protein